MQYEKIRIRFVTVTDSIPIMQYERDKNKVCYRNWFNTNNGMQILLNLNFNFCLTCMGSMETPI